MNPTIIFGGIIFLFAVVVVVCAGAYDEFETLADNEISDNTQSNFVKAIPPVFMVLCCGIFLLIFFRGALG